MIRRPGLNQTLVRRIRSLAVVDAHNALMRTSDREIAMAMMYMDNPDRNYLLSLLPRPKARRVGEELRLHQRLTIRYDQYAAAVDGMMASLDPGGRPSSFRSYLRPKRTRRR